jgi:hypothetical protein
MALRGSLREFELPDIFQLIANDGKTGQLVIYNKEDEAFAIFFRGAVIAAGNNLANLQTILFKYLMDVRHYSENELNELLYVCQGKMSLFTQELVNKRYLGKEELSTLSRMGIEDLTCGLFLWENGHYRFDSLESVDDYIVAGVSFSADAVTMEAMRRVDDWKRIKAVITPTTIFAPVQSVSPPLQADAVHFSIMAPAEYLLSLIDGFTSVETLCGTVFMTEYRIYEILLDLWQNNRIIPFKSPRHSSAVPAQYKLRKPNPILSAETFTVVIVHCVALLLFGAGFAFHSRVLEKQTLARHQAIRELYSFNSDNKLRIAALYFQALYGLAPTNTQELYKAALIGPGDAP